MKQKAWYSLLYDISSADVFLQVRFLRQQQTIKVVIEKAREYIEMLKLTAELQHTFMQRVDVYEKPINTNP